MPGRDDRVVFRTGLSYEAQMVSDALSDAGIPSYQRLENSAGVEVAMPPLPVQGPGVHFLVCVPQSATADAQDLIATFPVTKESSPGAFAFTSSHRAKKGWRIYAIVSLAFLLLFLVIHVIKIIRVIGDW